MFLRMFEDVANRKEANLSRDIIVWEKKWLGARLKDALQVRRFIITKK